MAGPLTPPVGTRFSTGEDRYLLSGPTSAPGGAVIVTPGVTDLNAASASNPAGTTFYLLAGTHVLGGASPTSGSAVTPLTGNTYIGAPGAIIDGRNINAYCFVGAATGVTVKYLEIRNFVCPINQFVVNQTPSDGWTVQYCNVHDCGGAGVGLASNSLLSYCWLHNNGQYGFSSYKPPVSNGAVPAINNVTVDHCEVSYNGTVADEIDPNTNLATGNGRNGSGKFWNTNGITVTNNWFHNGNWNGVWADTNNTVIDIENNLFETHYGEALIIEVSYNFLVQNNTFRRNAIGFGKWNAGQGGNNFPVPAVYISESGGDSAVSATYAASAIQTNTFIDNWGDLTLWESADRFCNSFPGIVYKPMGHGASYAICNNPTAKTLTISLTSGSPNFTVTSGTLEHTDEGRPISGTGIPTGAHVQEPGNANGFASGFLSATSGILDTNATTTGSVTATLAAGTINTQPGYSICRWKTQNITVQNNTFSHNRAAVIGGATILTTVFTGKVALLSQYGSYPSWSPYRGFVVSDAITFSQNNVWSNNTYTGDYVFMAHDTGIQLNNTQWAAAPYNQDAGSSLTKWSNNYQWTNYNNTKTLIGASSKTNYAGQPVTLMTIKANWSA